MKIYLVRHGETDWNLQRRFQGREDIALNDNGILQAKQCGQVLKMVNFKAVITSPLIRAKRTAKLIAELIGTEQVIVDDGLIERDFARLSGLSQEERKAFYESGQEDGMEPFEDLCNRMMSSIRKYADLYYDDNILIVSHGASINAVLSVISKGEVGSGKTRLKNTCINRIEYNKNNQTMNLDFYNVTVDEYQLILRKE